MEGHSEKNNEEATINMVMAIITRSKAFEEVAFQKRELFKGKDPQNWKEEKFKQLMVEIVQELQKDEKIQEL